MTFCRLQPEKRRTTKPRKRDGPPYGGLNSLIIIVLRSGACLGNMFDAGKCMLQEVIFQNDVLILAAETFCFL